MDIKNDSDVSSARASTTLRYAVLGFAIGYLTLWGGCGNFDTHGAYTTRDMALFAMGGALFAILGAILGAIMGSVRK